jgi:hypothetical protein
VLRETGSELADAGQSLLDLNGPNPVVTPAWLFYRSGDEDDLPGDVTGLELGERGSNVVEWVCALDRHDEVARCYRFGEFGQSRCARRGRAAVALDVVLLDRGEVDDRVDPVGRDAELERQLDVAAADEVDERGDRRVLGGRGDALLTPSPCATGTGPRSREPGVMALAGERDDAGARAERELDREHANAAARSGDHDRLTRGRGDGAHGRDPRRAGDEQRAGDLPLDLRGLRRQVGRLDEHALGVARAVVGIADHLVAHGYVVHARADLLDQPARSEPSPLGKVAGKISRTRPARIFASLMLTPAARTATSP